MYYEWRLGLVALSFTPFILIATFLQQRLMYIENQTQTETLQASTKVSTPTPKDQICNDLIMRYLFTKFR